MTSNSGSGNSIKEATRGRAKFSSHAKSLGASGFISPYDETQEADFLSKPGQTAIVNPSSDGIKNFEIGVAWDNVTATMHKKGLFHRLWGKKLQKSAEGVDLDIGCLYELDNNKRGAIQAFGNLYGCLEEEPYITLSGDERTGDAEGQDEVICVNGKKWDRIVRLVVYIYIYGGAKNLSLIHI